MSKALKGFRGANTAVTHSDDQDGLGQFLEAYSGGSFNQNRNVISNRAPGKPVAFSPN